MHSLYTDVYRKIHAWLHTLLKHLWYKVHIVKSIAKKKHFSKMNVE